MSQPKQYHEHLTIRVTKKQAKEIYEIAQRQDKTMSQVIRWSINRFLQQRTVIDTEA